MTLREHFEKRLFECGMFEDQAKSVMDLAVVSPALQSMAGRWSHSTSDYPTPVLGITWLAVKSVALKWIDVNKPQAWFRLNFCG